MYYNQYQIMAKEFEDLKSKFNEKRKIKKPKQRDYCDEYNLSYSFWSKTDLERHKQSVHSLSTESAEFDDYICETCGTSHLHPVVLHQHIILWNY